MKANHPWLKKITKLGLSLMMGVSMSADAGLFGLGGTSWKEEALLHDGSKIIVERSVERGGRHEIGQQPPIKEESLIFTLPTTNEHVTWKNKYSEDVGLADFMPMLVDIFQGAVYLASSPVGCLSYNKWGRPNPPYVVFKYEGKEWKRIPLQELPAEIKAPNLIISSPDNKVEEIGKNFVSAEIIRQINSSHTQPEYKTILREALVNAGNSCLKTDYYGKAGWLSLDWFSDQPTYQACLRFCERKGISPQDCPCVNLFKGK